jgi:hypothetical protein
LLPDNYLGLSGLQKQEALWNKVKSSRYEHLPEMTFRSDDELDPYGTGMHWLHLLHAGFDLAGAFAENGDEMLEGRIKVIHMFGSAAAVDFVADGSSPYTGLLRGGGPGLIRLSLAVPLKSTGQFIPGMALKLFVDGSPSRNVVAMEKLEGQGDDHNYFAHAFTNWLPDPVDTNTKVGRWMFERAVQDAIHLRVDHLANISSRGEPVDPWFAPEQLIFKPLITMDSNCTDFREELAKIPGGTELYQVYGRTVPLQNPEIYIGKIVTTSEFVAGPYEDELLYFQHDGAILK